MKPRLHALIQLLSDGRFHSGEALGAELSISRAAVWKLIPQLSDYGLNCYAVAGRGYRLERSFEPLSAEYLNREIEDWSGDLPMPQLTLLPEVDSTNLYLLRAAREGAGSGCVCVAEFQTAGRGRRGRTWVSPYGSNLYLSLLWRFSEGASALGGLSLAIAVAVAKSLENLGVEDVAIKWPNDILISGKKVAGILLDVAGETTGPCHVVIGVGVNYQMPTKAAEHIEQPWIDLVQAGVNVGRNKCVAVLLHQLTSAVTSYQREGLAPFHQEWSKRDITFGKPVRIFFGEQQVEGTSQGIDEHGQLLLDHQGSVRAYASGEVSLRLVAT